MPRFKVINDLNQIPNTIEWRDSVKFNSKDRLVDQNGKAVDTSYAGHKFLIIAKKERDFTFIEKVSGACNPVHGTSCNGRVKERYAIGMDTLSRLSEKELQQGINIPAETVEKIQRCMQSILAGAVPGGITVYNSYHEHRVFTVDNAPNLIFKMDTTPNPPRNQNHEIHSQTSPQQDSSEQVLSSRAIQQKSSAGYFSSNKPFKTVEPLALTQVISTPQEPLDEYSMKVRYQRMVEGVVEIRLNKLGLLIIPHAKMFTLPGEKGVEYDIIAEQLEDFVTDSHFQEVLYDSCEDTLDEAIRQLAVFICRTGYSDVERRNNPVHSTRVDQRGNRSIFLADFDAMDDVLTNKSGAAEIGLFGDVKNERTGLVCIVNKKQGEIVKRVAQNHSISTDKYEEAARRRSTELEEGRITNEKVKEFHRQKKIISDDQPVVVDPKSLGLDHRLYKDVIDDVVAAINTELKNMHRANLIKRKRWIDLDASKAPLNKHSEKKVEDVLVAFENKRVVFSAEAGTYNNSTTHYHIQA